MNASIRMVCFPKSENLFQYFIFYQLRKIKKINKKEKKRKVKAKNVEFICKKESD